MGKAGRQTQLASALVATAFFVECDLVTFSMDVRLELTYYCHASLRFPNPQATESVQSSKSNFSSTIEPAVSRRLLSEEVGT